jgi:hypothetical protein
MKKTLEKWQDTILDTNLQIKKLRDFFGCTENDFIDSMERLQMEYTRSIENLIGDEFGTLDWYWLENEMGERGHKAGANGNLKNIKNIDDLVWLLELTVGE